MDKYAPILTHDGSFTAAHPEHGETYHSTGGAELETNCLYMEASGFEAHLESSTNTQVSVIDIGFGLGLNALQTIDRWNASTFRGDLFLNSIEIDPELVEAVINSDVLWKSVWPHSWQRYLNLLSRSGDGYSYSGDAGKGKTLHWIISVTDAANSNWIDRHKQSFPRADFIWQDAFSESNCPSLWTPEYFALLKTVTSKKTRLATYSVSKSVRSALSEAGWHPERIAGAGRKRNWLIATI